MFSFTTIDAPASTEGRAKSPSILTENMSACPQINEMGSAAAVAFSFSRFKSKDRLSKRFEVVDGEIRKVSGVQSISTFATRMAHCAAVLSELRANGLRTEDDGEMVVTRMLKAAGPKKTIFNRETPRLAHRPRFARQVLCRAVGRSVRPRRCRADGKEPHGTSHRPEGDV